MRKESILKPDTGFFYEDGNPIRVGDRVDVVGYPCAGTVHRRTNMKGMSEYCYVTLSRNDVSNPTLAAYKQLSLKVAVEIGIAWHRPPSTIKKMNMIISEKKPPRVKVERQLYIVGPWDYDHVELGYK